MIVRFSALSLAAALAWPLPAALADHRRSGFRHQPGGHPTAGRFGGLHGGFGFDAGRFGFGGRFSFRRSKFAFGGSFGVPFHWGGFPYSYGAVLPPIYSFYPAYYPVAPVAVTYPAYSYGLPSPSLGISNYFATLRALRAESAPRVVYVPVPVDRESYREEPERRAEPERAEERERPEQPEGERFYLEPPSRPERETGRGAADLAEQVRRELEVVEAEAGVFLVRWRGAADGVASVEFHSVNADGEALHSRVLAAPPFRSLLRVPDEAASIHFYVRRKAGAEVALKLPVSEFRALIRD